MFSCVRDVIGDYLSILVKVGEKFKQFQELTIHLFRNIIASLYPFSMRYRDSFLNITVRSCAKYDVDLTVLIDTKC